MECVAAFAWNHWPDVVEYALDNPLFEMENVILTPHIGWQTIEARQRLVERLTEDISSYLSGKPVNVVN